MKKDKKLYIRKVLFINKLAFALLLGFIIVKTAIFLQQPEFFAPAPAVGDEDTGNPKLANPAGSSVRDYSAIIARNIFASATSPLPSSESLDGDNAGMMPLAEEELGLTLVGAICGNPTLARAIIKDAETGTPRLYRIGQTVAGACVKSIEEDAVILLHNGQDKMLKLKISGSDNESNIQVASLQTIKDKQVSRVVEPGPQVKQTAADIPARLGNMEILEALLDKAVIEPYAPAGQIEGLRITGLENISEAKDLGLKNGDIICVVNGQRLTSKQKAYQILKKARSQPVVGLELLRGNRIEKLSFAAINY